MIHNDHPEDHIHQAEGAEEDEEEQEEDLGDEIEIVDETDETTDPFVEIKPEKLSSYEDILFVKKMNHYYSYWNEWEPSVFLEKCIKNSINALS
mgnify:CR=1 FL=1